MTRTNATGNDATGGRDPDLRMERRLFKQGATSIVALDEVGRGALAGPVMVGAVRVSRDCVGFPAGLRDSKLLSPAARRRLLPLIDGWVSASAVGRASAAEVDRHGIIGALRLAGRRAVAALDQTPGMVLLDGNFDWLNAEGLVPLAVVTVVKGDRRCASIAAASVLAKESRDAVMAGLARRHPVYGWDRNKGYASGEHLAAIGVHGLSSQHRRSWRIPGLVS